MSTGPLIVDAHVDLAWNMASYGRDYTRAVAETRRLEADSQAVAQNGDTLLGWPEFQRGRVALIFSTLFAAPHRHRLYQNETQVYKTFNEAHALCRDQLLAYHRLTDDHPDKFRLIHSTADLNALLACWQAPAADGCPVGLLALMEGAEAIRSPAELEEWHALGLRMIGLAWVGTRYSGGWKEPGPLTEAGRELLRAMADLNFILDVSHMDEPAALEALGRFDGPVVATHGNCRALLPDFPTNRQFSDRVLRGVIERDGCVGVVPYNIFLKVGWTREHSKRSEVSVDGLVHHIDHICQLAGDSRHVGIGSDFDGGFGLQSVPFELDTVADLQLLAPLLRSRGYSADDTADILGRNWLRCLERDLPRS
jgi:membrane dipeptidase